MPAAHISVAEFNRLKKTSKTPIRDPRDWNKKFDSGLEEDFFNSGYLAVIQRWQYKYGGKWRVEEIHAHPFKKSGGFNLPGGSYSPDFYMVLIETSRPVGVAVHVMVETKPQRTDKKGKTYRAVRTIAIRGQNSVPLLPSTDPFTS